MTATRLDDSSAAEGERFGPAILDKVGVGKSINASGYVVAKKTLGESLHDAGPNQGRKSTTRQPAPSRPESRATAGRSYLEALTGTSENLPPLIRQKVSVDLAPLKLHRVRESKPDPRYAEMEASFQGALQLQEHRRRQLFLRAEANARGGMSDGSVTSENVSLLSFKSPREEVQVMSLHGRSSLRPIDAHGDQFFPLTRNGPSSLPITRMADFARTVSHPIGVGIEAEFLLRPLSQRDRDSSIDLFAERVVDNHNHSLQHPDKRLMVNQVGTYPLRTEHDYWSLIDDSILAKGPASECSLC